MAQAQVQIPVQNYEIFGDNLAQIKTAFKTFENREFKTLWGTEGESFYVTVPEDRVSLFRSLLTGYPLLKCRDLATRHLLEIGTSQAVQEPNGHGNGHADTDTIAVPPLSPPEKRKFPSRGRSLREAYECKEPGCDHPPFMGEKARWHLVAHIRLKHRRKKVVKSKEPGVQEAVVSVQAYIDSFNSKISSLEAEKEEIEQELGRKIKMLGEEIKAAKAAKRQFTAEILTAIKPKRSS